ncbi:MAG: excinuclease ABC subunit UvrC [Actinobacteria bacterium]|jgi:excinuclease ABC subunit C|nr:excinuclease ABC subunit UvrC [Acidimicrobiaceae bacterium]MBP6486299.1 excinuclease ABC subunit UvrC [Ilumatobacteraceae bacterium]NMD23783.1 excinuclease ABC subunit UvrC [Actinomycetota bacterium]MBP7887627.1 excinuclease ABC subunit UvrC [Ilumatobacteraceae bacterium]MBP8207979.1 excinuclease ABC subunit UvrC [Ilumatobacteraceae bacterium]
MVERPPTGTIPETPGSYQFKDKEGRVIYVGKASSLRQRLSNYFQDPRNMHPRTAQMVATATSVEWIEVRNEVEALMLEFSLIQLHRPRFNVRLRDDKSYPFLAVTLDEQYPRALVMRGRKRKGTRYFGPYAHAYAIRDTLDLLLRSFPIRTCSPGKFNEHHRLGRPCLLFHIEKCCGPCVGEVEEMPYRQLVQELCDFLDGDTDEIVKRLEAEMAGAAKELEYERAARLRDRLLAVRKAIEKQQMVAERSEDIDVIGIADDELEAAVQVFFVRKGRVVGRKGFVLDKVEELSPGGLVDRILESLYGDDPPAGVPKQVLVPVAPDDTATYEEWLTHLRGSRVQIRVAQRGDKRELHETVTRNAREEFMRHRLRRAGDHNARSRAITELQDLLGLPEAPLRIECYDMAHLQGTDYVGSMVVLEDGLPNKREYRRFKVKDVAGNDDYAAMEEVLTRRLQAYLNERDQPLDEDLIDGERRRPRKFAYPPQLLLVDGGKGQLAVAERVVRALGLHDEIPIASLAKRFEEVFVPGRGEPIEVPRGSDALFMLQRIRDEAHRFANTFHRELRGKRMTTSSLDGIPGLGDARKKKLTQVMGGVNAVKKASLDELKALSFLPDAVAEAIHEKFHRA